MIGETKQNPYVDKITEILQRRAQPEPVSTQEMGSMAFGNALNRFTGGNVQNVLQAIKGVESERLGQAQAQQDREFAQAKGLYDVFEQQREAGDKQAQALFDKMNMFTGGDPEGNAMFLEALHSDPEDVDPSNAYQVMTKLAGIAKKSGYVSPEQQMNKLKLQDAQLGIQSTKLGMDKTRAEINKLNNPDLTPVDQPADVKTFQYYQSLSPEQKKEFEKVSGVKTDGRELKSTEMKEIFDAEDVVNAASDSISILDQMNNLNSLPTYEGAYAVERAAAERLNPLGQSQDSLNTLEIENLAKNLAASMLKTTFTGAISNAEREFLQDLQASANKSVAERQRIINNGKKLIESRAKRAQTKQQRIQSGDYATKPAEMSATNLSDGGTISLDDFLNEQ